ncbi:hypothetical protein [Nocardioides coralli]|uniref:hypothetical protein n=1 Tax=Nocardioides coralli TaxID=2872154 RepID=UPI001CA3FCCA|nr:hypothetical protein [Nocardioides coralli]QZY30609.1 hypothetical protein K6T13_08200 [Nocardioides coralli]
MSTDIDLRSALRDLADDAPSQVLVASELWRDGTRRHRRRRTLGTALSLVAALVVGAALAGGPWTWREPDPVDSPDGALSIPRTIYPPDEWAPSVAEAGAPGPLAVVAHSFRTSAAGFGGGVSTDLEVFGISAADGRAYFLDLVGEAVLSPDGHRVAVGRQRAEARAAGRTSRDGWDVYDAVTGGTTAVRVPDGGRSLSDVPDLPMFSGDSRHLMAAVKQASGQRVLMVWDLATGRHRVVARASSVGVVGTDARGFAWTDGRSTLTRLDPVSGSTTSERLGSGALLDVAVADDGRVAFLSLEDGRRLLVDDGSGAEEVSLDGQPAGDIQGWAGPQHLVVDAREALRVDVNTATVEPLGLDESQVQGSPSYAIDLFADPLVAGVPQPDHRDPRWWFWWWPWNLLAALVLLWLVARTVGTVRRRRARV